MCVVSMMLATMLLSMMMPYVSIEKFATADSGISKGNIIFSRRRNEKTLKIKKNAATMAMGKEAVNRAGTACSAFMAAIIFRQNVMFKTNVKYKAISKVKTGAEILNFGSVMAIGQRFYQRLHQRGTKTCRLYKRTIRFRITVNNYTENDVPHPQDDVAFGLVILKCAPIKSSV